MKKKLIRLFTIGIISVSLLLIGCNKEEVKADKVSAFRTISTDKVGDNITLTVVEYKETGDRYIITSQYQKPGSIIKMN